jgi:hypothetical protein
MRVICALLLLSVVGIHGCTKLVDPVNKVKDCNDKKRLAAAMWGVVAARLSLSPDEISDPRCYPAVRQVADMADSGRKAVEVKHEADGASFVCRKEKAEIKKMLSDGVFISERALEICSEVEL